MMLEKLEGLADRFDELQALLASPDLYSDPARAAQLLREQKELTPIITAYRRYAAAVQEQNDALELLDEAGGDAELRAMAQESLNTSRSEIDRLEQELKILLLPHDPNDNRSVIMEIRAGAGGEEAALFAAHLKPSNLVAIIDNNDLQIDGHCSALVGLTNIAQRFSAFGWQVLEVDGHDVAALHQALTKAKEAADGPYAIVAHTVKGKGVSFMEDQVGWHGKAPNAEQAAQAFEELGGAPAWYVELTEGRR